MKKLFKVFTVCAAAALLSLTIVLSACGDKETFSETYTGAVSEQSYVSANAAVSAFVETELSGNANQAVFVSYEKEKELTEEEQAVLPLPESAKQGLVSVEKGKVNYKESAVSTQAAASDTLTLWKGVYVLNYGSSFRYYTPALSTGETLTKSYYDSVFDVENYKNVTMSTSMALDMNVSAEGQTVTMKMVMTYSYKITEDAVALEMTVSMDMLGMSSTETQSYYIIEKNGGLMCAANAGDAWYAASLDELDLDLEIDSIEDIYKSAYSDELDQSYFVKTDSGFKMDENKMQEYLAVAFEDMEDMFAEVGIHDFNNQVKADASYYIKEGKLARSNAALSMNMAMTTQGVTANTVISASINCNYSNYGNTTVSIPSGAKQVLGLN